MAVLAERLRRRRVWGPVADMAVLGILVAWAWYNSDPEGHSASWGVVTAAAVLVAAGLTALALVAVRRDAGSGTAPVASVLAVVVWFVGVLMYLAVAYIGFGTACGGTSGACSWACLNQAGSSWQALSIMCVVAATVAMPVLAVASRQVGSRVVGRTAPGLVLVLFVVAVLLASPRGSDTQCFAASGRACGNVVSAER